MDKVYVGLDLGSSSFQQGALNQEGAKIMNRSFPTSEANLRSAFAKLPGEIHVHLEAGELAPWAAPETRLLVGLWPAQGCVRQSLRGGVAPAPRQCLQAYLPARARDHARPDACAPDRTTQNPFDLESNLVNEDTLSR